MTAQRICTYCGARWRGKLGDSCRRCGAKQCPCDACKEQLARAAAAEREIAALHIDLGGEA